MIEDKEGAEVIMGDILVWGTTIEEHNRILKIVLDKAWKYNLQLSPNKTEFRKEQIQYVRHVLSSEGLKPDYQKLKAVEQMKAPQSKKGTTTFFILKMEEPQASVNHNGRRLITNNWGIKYKQCLNKK